MIKAQVYAYNRGCCGVNIFDFLAGREVEAEFISMQIPSNSHKAYEIARAAKMEDKDIFFPLVVMEGGIVAGFVPDKLDDIIRKSKEQENG